MISSRTDAWQKAFGYLDAYNRAAPYLSMVFDSYPIYFDYEGRTWLVQIWKGQYGICTGCEIGLYYADGIVKRVIIRKHFSMRWVSQTGWICLLRCGKTASGLPVWIKGTGGLRYLTPEIFRDHRSYPWMYRFISEIMSLEENFAKH